MEEARRDRVTGWECVGVGGVLLRRRDSYSVLDC